MKKIIIFRRVYLISLLIILAITQSSAQSYASPSVSCPHRIISLGPAVTVGIILLEQQEKLVGVTSYCNEILKLRGKEVVGNVMQANVEKIVRLRPDLVIATALTNPRMVDRLRQLGISITVFGQPDSFQEICEQFLKLGTLLCSEGKARETVKKSKEMVNLITHKVYGLKKPRVFCQIGTKPLFAASGDSFMNDFIERAGGINIAKNAKIGLYSREDVLLQNPDIILIATMGMVGEEEKKKWQRFDTMKAVRENRIYLIDAYQICSPTPVSFAKTLRDLAVIFHPETIHPPMNNGLSKAK